MPIIYSNYKKTNNGFNVGGQEIGFLSEIPFGIQYFETLKIWDKLAKECGLIQYCTPLEDELGESARTSVRGLALVGDGNTYVQFDDFVDSNLPTNYEIEWDGVYKFNATNEGFFGFDVLSATDRFVVRGEGIEGRIRLYLYDVNDLNLTSLVDGDDINIKLNVVGNNVIFTINGMEYFNGTFTKSLSNKSLQLLTSGENINVSAHICNYFKITDTDTNEVIFNPNFEMRQSDGIIESLADDGSKIEGEQFISPANPTVLSLMESQQDKLGVTFADGSQYRDAALTTPYDIGTPILNNYAYVSDGQGGSKKNTVEFNGAIKKNFRAVDGVVDNKPNYEAWDIASCSDCSVGENGIEFNALNERPLAFIDNGQLQLEESTEYLVVLDVAVNTFSQGFRSSVSAADPWTDSTIIVPANSTGQFRVLRTTKADFTGVGRNGYIAFINGTGQFQAKVRHFLASSFTNPLTDPLPTSGVYESGNSKILDQPYDGIGEYDTNRILTDATHEPKLITFDDSPNIDKDQFYQSEDKQLSLFFEEPLERHSTCDSKVRKLLDMNEQYFVQTAEGSGEYEPYLVDDGTGNKVPFNVLKEWVEVIE